MLAGILNAVLDGLNGTSSDIEASAILTKDGLILAYTPLAGIHPDRLAAAGASLFSLGKQLATEMLQGKMGQMVVMGATGCVLLDPVGLEAVLIVLVRQGAAVDQASLAAGQAAVNLLASLTKLAKTHSR